jgi:transposase
MIAERLLEGDKDFAILISTKALLDTSRFVLLRSQMEGILLGLGTSFIIEQVTQESDQLIIAGRSIAVLSSCPLCASSSERVHSHYQRTVADLPCSGCQVTLKLIVRRFFCDNDQCQRRIFSERLPELLVPYAQMTNRLREALRALSFATSVEAASRLVRHIGMKTSPSSLLRIQKSTSLPEPAPFTRIGIDDFAFRKRKTYGTIIINLDTRYP